MMKVSSGRLDGLPGRSRMEMLDEADMCSKHPKRKSVFCIQGETDSFGAEFVHMCLRCKGRYLMWKRENPEGPLGSCDSCHAMDVPVKPWRDPDEGQAGPVYYQCAPCRAARPTREREYIEQDMKDHPEDYEYNPRETGEDDWDPRDDEYLMDEECNPEPEVYFGEPSQFIQDSPEQAPDRLDVVQTEGRIRRASISMVSDFELAAQLVHRRFLQRFPRPHFSVSDVKAIWVYKKRCDIKRRFANKEK